MDELDEKFSNLDKTLRDEISFIYRGQGAYFTSIIRGMSDIGFNWAFTLNTGALAVVVGFMGAVIKWGDLSCKDILSFVLIELIFSLGIVSIVVAVKFEHKRFSEKAKLLDINFHNLVNDRINPKVFMENIPSKSTLDWLTPLFENISYILFFIGLISSIFILVFIS